MSDITDRTVGRYVDQDPDRQKAYALDPMTHHEIELMRRTLAAVERALAYENVHADVQHRVINRVVWGDPDGLVDVHAQVRKQVLAAYDLPTELTDAWKAIHAQGLPCPAASEEKST